MIAAMPIFRAFRRSRLGRAAAFAAVLAILLQVFVPAQAFAAATAARVPVCTAAGIVWLSLDGQPAQHDGALSSHCPFCVPQGSAFVPPVPPIIRAPRHLVRFFAAVAPVVAPAAAPDRRAHASRAPPTAA